MSTVALLALAITQQRIVFRQYDMIDPDGAPSRLRLLNMSRRLDPSKKSPRAFGDPPVQWEFDWLTAGYGKLGDGENDQPELRFRVYSQQKTDETDIGLEVSKMLVRLWDLNYRKLKVDHDRQYQSGLVDVFLCWGGEAGGEQLIDTETVNGRTVKVNTIYIYDLASFQNPVERAREVAHEYGHAALPAVGGFQQPEDWANGFLGERLYLQFIRDEMKANRYGSPDAMGATYPALAAWCRTHVDPLVAEAAKSGPELATGGVGPAAMGRFHGVAIYVANVLGYDTFARAFKFVEPRRPEMLTDAVVQAAEELPRRVLNLRAYAGQTVWVPVGESRLEGARVLRRNKGWAQIQVGQTPIAIARTN
ncbi:MAG: hypothetical protein SFX74_07440 [Fimbriimonadaceae bacterium]|nr:hypothetical protein [Fimbriimonadaceae bacterium]